MSAPFLALALLCALFMLAAATAGALAVWLLLAAAALAELSLRLWREALQCLREADQA